MNKRLIVTLTLLSLVFMFSQCSDDEGGKSAGDIQEEALKPATPSSVNCSTCTYIVPADVSTIDGDVLNLKPGDVICLNAATKYTKSLTFKNIIGTAQSPIIITNCGGVANLTVSSRPFNFKTSNSKYFRITGGNVKNGYGIRISGSTSNGMVLTELSTNFEVDHVEVFNVGFAGIMAKTDPSCDNATNRGYFTMRNISIHDTYIHDTDGEGMYIGHSFYGGYELDCGVKLPHTIEGAKIFDNRVTDTGWDGIQLACATVGAEVYGNTVQNFGTAKKADQNYGILLSSGTGGVCHSNYIKGGSGTAMTVFGLGDNLIYNNIIINSAHTGIFCDERTDNLGDGYQVLNNTIINPKEVGIRMYGEKVPKNVVINNIVVNPGAFGEHGESAFIMKLNSMNNVEQSNNLTTRNIGDVKFVDSGKANFRLKGESPAVDKGKSISSYDIDLDFYKSTRLKGDAYDIGASEYQ